MVDIDSFKDFLGITKAELARRLGLDEKTNTLSLYQNGKSTPKYEMCAKLLNMGMTIEELFGKEIASRVVVSRDAADVHSAAVGAKLDLADPDVKSAIQQAVRDMFLDLPNTSGNQK